MSSLIYIFDTSVLCCWLDVPGKETCGPRTDPWDKNRMETLVQKGLKENAIFVLPLASIIETGNHIAQSGGDRRTVALALAELIRKTAVSETPWAAFDAQSELWSSESLEQLANEWPDLAIGGLGIGDCTIKNVANYYAKVPGYTVKILTGDQGLKAYEPLETTTLVPRRRRYSTK